MNEVKQRIKQLEKECTTFHEFKTESGHTRQQLRFDKEKFAELIIQECANFVRESYDHADAECIAWNMEIKYGLHGDYA